MRKWFAILTLALLTGSCTFSIHQVYVSDYSPYTGKKKGKPIEARTEQFVVLGFATESNYVEHAYAMLQRQCKGGDINGVTTQYSTSHGFFSWTNKLLVQARCMR